MVDIAICVIFAEFYVNVVLRTGPSFWDILFVDYCVDVRTLSERFRMF